MAGSGSERKFEIDGRGISGKVARVIGREHDALPKINVVAGNCVAVWNNVSTQKQAQLILVHVLADGVRADQGEAAHKSNEA
jgi:hypothetical protein